MVGGGPEGDGVAERIGGRQYGKSGAIYKFEKIKRAKRAAMAAHPGRVQALALFDGEEYVILRGTAVVIDDPDRGQAEAMALARRYGGDPDAHAGQVRVSIVFDPREVALHGRLAESAS